MAGSNPPAPLGRALAPLVLAVAGDCCVRIPSIPKNCCIENNLHGAGLSVGPPHRWLAGAGTDDESCPAKARWLAARRTVQQHELKGIKMKCLKSILVLALAGFFFQLSLHAQRMATAIPTLVNGFLVAITVTYGGAGYTMAPTVTITGGNGSGAMALASLNNGSVSQILVTDSGSGYTSIPIVTLAPPPSSRTATGTATVANGFLVSITVNDGGSGYTSPPAVAITGGNGSGAIAVATIANGVVDKIIVENAGKNYTTMPAVVIEAPPSPKPPFSDGLVAYYPFNGNANDESGNGNNGLRHGCQLAVDRFTTVNSSYLFNGASDYIEVPSAASLRFGNQITVTAWIKYDSFTESVSDCIAAKGKDAESSLDWALVVIKTGKRLRPHVNLGGGRWIYLDCSTELLAGHLYHVAMIFDGTRLSGFVNGVLDGSTPASGSIVATDFPLRIGAYAPINGLPVGGSKSFFSGNIDDVRIYSRALSSNEVQQLYTYEAPPKPPFSDGLVAYYPFNGNANDESGSGNNGTIHGASLTTDRFGSLNKAFAFNGSSYISMGDIHVLDNTKTLTASAWFRLEHIPSDWEQLMADGSYADLNGWGLLIGSTKVHIRSGNVNWAADGSCLFESNKWYCSAFVLNSNSLSLYINGRLIQNQPIQSTVDLNTSRSFQVGKGDLPNNGFEYWFNGSIDDVRIYNRALSSNEVQQLYAYEAPTKQEPPAEMAKIYYTSLTSTGPQSFIKRVNEDGSGITTLVAGVSHPRSIALDVLGGKMYWNEPGIPAIRRASLDGTGPVETVVTTGNHAYGLALDPAAGKIYWATAHKISDAINSILIRRANLDGSGQEDLVTTGLIFPVGIALDTVRGKLYWTDLEGNLDGTGSIHRSNLDGTKAEKLLAGIDEAYGIACDAVGGKIYWAESATKKIQRANLDGTGMEDLVTGIGSPTTISLDLAARKMYWTDSDWSGQTNRIQRANLDGSNVEVVVTDYFAWGIAVAPSPVVAPHQATATAQVVNGFVVGATITDPGYGYTNAPLVEIVGGGGTGATAIASISNGAVTAITVTGAGKGYTSTPIVRIGSPFLAPAIAAQPQSLAVPVGGLAAFQVAATGTAPLHYQWLKNGAAIAAATAASYAIASVQLADAGTYSVVVTNIAGSVVSQVAQLTVNVPPSITSQPLSLSVTAGGLATFSVAATGTAPLDYQWLKNGDAIAGATATLFTINEAQAADAGNYSVRVANIAGSVVSQVAQLTVNVPPSITGQPGSLTVPNGGLAVFQVAATGMPPLSYQWYVDATAIPAATNASLTIANAYYEHAGNYSVVVSSPCGSQASQIAVLVVKVVPNFVLNDLTPGGGFVMPEPFQSSFAPNSFVTLTAMPADGWTFLDWKGNTQGANPVVTLQVTSDKTVRARFGTQITVKPSGSGAVSADPASELYPYGASVRIVAQPQPGHWFTGWSGSASGDANPLTMVIQDANPVVVASFAALPAGFGALTLIPDGYGEVSVLPVANTFTNGQAVTLNALPNKGQEFLGWSGDAAGSSPSLEVAMSQSKVINASFTKRPHLDIQPLDGDGVLLTLAGEFSAAYSLLASTNLVNWAPHLTLTNSYGEAQIMDPLTADQSLFYRAAAPGQARRTATAIPTLVNGFLVAITVTDGGAGYTTPPAVAITGGGGSGATATATVLHGVVDKIIVANAGNGYTGTPAVVIAAP